MPEAGGADAAEAVRAAEAPVGEIPPKASDADGSSSSDEGPCAGTDIAVPKAKRPKWWPLESNPEILNGFMERVGVVAGWSFVDVWSVQPEMLSMVPQPAMAVCLLFPSKPVRKARREALDARQSSTEAPPATFYLVQHKEFGNACGTIAAVHAVGNLARSGHMQLLPGSPIAAFLEEAAPLGPADAGRALARAAPLHEASDAAARSERAQTRTPGRDDSVDGHFVVFVPVEGQVVELDGCMGRPISHGAVSAAGFLQDVAKLIQDDFMSRAPGNLNFTIMALVPAGASAFGGGHHAGGGEDDWLASTLASAGDVAVDESKVQLLVGMGFDAERARLALISTNGNLEVAAELLLSEA